MAKRTRQTVGCIPGEAVECADLKQAKEALRDSEERYRALIENAHDMIQSIAPDGTIAYCNRAWAETLGYSDAELPELTLFNIIHPNSQAHCQEMFVKVMSGESIHNVQATFVTKDGRSIQVEGNVTPRIVEGKVIASHGIFRDITERKRAEKLSQESEEKYRKIFETTREGVIVAIPGGRILSANAAAASILGYDSSQELVGMLGYELYADSGQRKMVQAALERKDYVEDMELTLRRKDGTLVHVLGSAMIHRDQQGRPVRVESVWTDITERKEMEQELQRNHDINVVVNSLLRLSLQNTSLEDILKRALDLILSVSWLAFQSRGAIFLVEKSPQVLVIKAQNGLAQPIQEACAQVPFGQCLCGQAALTREIQFADRVDKRHSTHYEGMVSHGHYCVPISVGDKVYGVMNL